MFSLRGCGEKVVVGVISKMIVIVVVKCGRRVGFVRLWWPGCRWGL